MEREYLERSFHPRKSLNYFFATSVPGIKGLLLAAVGLLSSEVPLHVQFKADTE